MAGRGRGLIALLALGFLANAAADLRPALALPGGDPVAKTPNVGPSRPKAPSQGPEKRHTALEPLPPTDAISVLGKKVRGVSGEDMGLVVDVLLDSRARPRAVVIDFGGFLGVGSRKIAVDWCLVRLAPEDREAPLVLRLDRSDIQTAPEYNETALRPLMVGPLHVAASARAPDVAR